MTRYNFGDVVLVPFPFSDLTQCKKRPSVIVSPAVYQQTRPDCILLAITGQIRSPLSYGEAVIQAWREAGLLKPSLFKPLVFTLEQSGILRKLGSLTEIDQETLHHILQQIIQQNGQP
ncbi:MAG: type II toxin-antitoxin system PemK/MazF family toxin [Pseudomonadota bacterium]